MTLTHKDVVATVLTTLVVVVFAATHEGWNVWLVGDSRRWAAGVILVLGIATCAQGSPTKGRGTSLLASLGMLAFVLAMFALATGSLTVVSLLVADIVLLWALSTFRHAAHEGKPPKLIAT